MEKRNQFVIKYQLILFFFVVLTISWSFWIPMALDRLQIISFPLPIIVGSTIGAFAPLITLFIFDKITKGEISLDKIFSGMRPNKNQIPWLIVAAVIIPLSYVIGNVIYIIVEESSDGNILNPGPLGDFGYGLFIIMPVTFFAALLSSPLGEEPGWRGFAISKLQAKFGLHLGSLILGSFWWLWHQPINIANDLEVTLHSYFVMVLSSFIYDSVFNLSRKNILSAMFAHSSSFITFTYIYRDKNNWWAIAVLLLNVILIRIIEWHRNNKQKTSSLN